MRCLETSEFEVEFQLRPDRANYEDWNRQVASGCQGCVEAGADGEAFSPAATTPEESRDERENHRMRRDGSRAICWKATMLGIGTRSVVASPEYVEKKRILQQESGKGENEKMKQGDG